MFGCFRRGDANDPDIYVAACTAVLTHYTAEVVKTVTDPYSGLPSSKSETGWSGLPDVADVKQACEAEAARLARMQRYIALPRNQPRLPRPALQAGDLATIFVPPDAPQYAAMIERVGNPKTDAREWRYDEKRPGVWVAYTWLATSGRSAWRTKAPMVPAAPEIEPADSSQP